MIAAQQLRGCVVGVARRLRREHPVRSEQTQYPVGGVGIEPRARTDLGRRRRDGADRIGNAEHRGDVQATRRDVCLREIADDLRRRQRSIHGLADRYWMI